MVMFHSFLLVYQRVITRMAEQEDPSLTRTTEESNSRPLQLRQGAMSHVETLRRCGFIQHFWPEQNAVSLVG